MSWLVLVALAAAPLDGGVEDAAVVALQQRADALEAQVETLERKLDETLALAHSLDTRLTGKERFKVEVGGYLDLGFFMVQGNGSGVRRDLGRTTQRYPDVLSSWVLVGDPLSTAINSRGDVAELGDSRAIRFDALQSKGRPTFLVNALNLSFHASVDDMWFVTALVDFLPRERAFAGGAVGDFIDVKMASLRWQKRFDWGLLTFNAGKFDSMQGIEYRQQEAPQRLTITPSLLCRYTCGRPLGLKVRGEFFDSMLEVGLAVTNGSSEVEQFPFSNETDFNIFKTVSGRVALRLPVGQGLEVSASGAVGAQDRQTDDTVMQWHLGAAARLEWGRFQLQAEYVLGRANGRDLGSVRCGAAACLSYKGAYGLVGVRFGYIFLPYVRVDWRQADMRSATDYAYMSDVVRATVGLRIEPHSRIAVKAEYTFNHELTAFQFPDDVLTTSFVVSY
jgi:hypothetical protein